MVAANLVEVAALVGDTARATMLAALMSGQALTGSELAHVARVTRPTASQHLAKLTQARLIGVVRQGRFSYYRIVSPLVARMLESIIAVAAIDVPARYRPRSAHDDALAFARTCYDHLAGRLGVAVADALVARGHIVLTDEGGEVSDQGKDFFAAFGVDLNSPARSASSANPVSIGASGASTSPALLARRSGTAASHLTGSRAKLPHGWCGSRAKASEDCGRRSASSWARL